jgi:hypothetical protein
MASANQPAKPFLIIFGAATTTEVAADALMPARNWPRALYKTLRIFIPNYCLCVTKKQAYF